MSQACHNTSLSVTEARERTVADVMLARPKTLRADATVTDLRRLLENEHIVTVLLVEGDHYVGSVERSAVLDGLAGSTPAASLAQPGDTIVPDAPMSEALARFDATGGRRLVVVEPDGRLAGLLCLGSGRNAFCR
ncbi:MAG: CBS domain-containing protein [Gaiella sp.]